MIYNKNRTGGIVNNKHFTDFDSGVKSMTSPNDHL